MHLLLLFLMLLGFAFVSRVGVLSVFADFSVPAIDAGVGNTLVVDGLVSGELRAFWGSMTSDEVASSQAACLPTQMAAA